VLIIELSNLRPLKKFVLLVEFTYPKINKIRSLTQVFFKINNAVKQPWKVQFPMNLKHLSGNNDLYKTFAILFILFLISSCSTTSKSPRSASNTSTNSVTQTQPSALDKALAARGFYKSQLGNIITSMLDNVKIISCRAIVAR
jgi:hypothetical protein